MSYSLTESKAVDEHQQQKTEERKKKRLNRSRFLIGFWGVKSKSWREKVKIKNKIKVLLNAQRNKTALKTVKRKRPRNVRDILQIFLKFCQSYRKYV